MWWSPVSVSHLLRLRPDLNVCLASAKSAKRKHRAIPTASGEDADADESEDEWDGIPDEITEEPPLDREEEYIDEDRYTTVTIEAVNIDRDGIHKPGGRSEEENSDGESEGKSNKTGLDGNEVLELYDWQCQCRYPLFC